MLSRSGLCFLLPLFHFRVVMTDDTADGRARDSMMTGNMPGDGTDGGAFDTALGMNQARQGRHDRAQDQGR